MAFPPNREVLAGASKSFQYSVFLPTERSISGNSPFETNAIVLYNYFEAPYYLRGNPYIKTGYRAYINFRSCLKSLFLVSNEFINVWSHLLGFVYFFYLMVFDCLVLLPQSGAGYQDYTVFCTFLGCYQVCMLFSSGYHLFCCHSEKVYRLWFSLDLAGISLGLCGCYIASVYYAFYCQLKYQILYTSTIVILTTVSLVLQIHPKFLSPKWKSKRIFLFCSMASFGLIPSTHWLLSLGWGPDIVQMFYPRIWSMYFLGLLAMMFYAFKLPERFLPGKVDYLGSSHQWWHLFVVVAFYHWHWTNVMAMQYRLAKGCPELEYDLS